MVLGSVIELSAKHNNGEGLCIQKSHLLSFFYVPLKEVQDFHPKS